MALFDAVDIIRVKRDGGVLTPDQIDWTIDAYTKGVIKDEQMAALAMAIFLRGMDRGEIARWTDAMIRSGARMDFSGIGKPTADKHSTGGVGDKITLPLAPLVACFGVAVPQLSGRGLGHTGGTLDKLEAIPGWRAQLSNDEIMTQLGQGCGAVICAAGSGLAPADKKLYALRDITSTVESIALIASSIMSKKIAEGTGALVLDVKVGSGAFMKDLDAARELARTMVDLGRDAGVATRALLTDMSVPLGRKIGNALEVEESVEVLAGGGPADVIELTCELARNMLDLAGVRRRGGRPGGWARDGPLARDDPRTGRRSGCSAAACSTHAPGARRGRWDSGWHGRAQRGCRLLAPGCGARGQGGSRAGGRRHRDPRQAGRARQGGPTPAHAPHRRRVAHRARP